MNNIDDILERLKGQQPMIDDPDALTEQIMNSVEASPHPSTGGEDIPTQALPLWRWFSIAASIILIIGIGATLLLREDASKPETAVAKVGKPATVDHGDGSTVDHGEVSPDPSPQGTPLPSRGGAGVGSVTSTHGDSSPDPSPQGTPLPSRGGAGVGSVTSTENDPNLHYAAQDLTKDTIPYQDPARVDDFIARLADYNKVKEGALTCSATKDSSVVSAVYVFPDKDEIDVFGRLLQVACWYDSKTPGYHLNFSQQQFFFELKDMRQQLQYRWIAERINGRILFYGTHAPLGTKASSACYQQYRDELMYHNSFNINPKKI